MSFVMLFVIGLIVSAITIHLAITLAHRFNVVDQPGGHKLHKSSTPFVGGVGVFSALLCALFLLDQQQLFSASHWSALTLGSLLIFLTGFADDVWRLSFKFRFVIQAVAALLMAFWAGVVLLDLGALAWGLPLQLGMLSIPFTIFATIGVINALNMIDGIDGLSGTLSLVSLFLISLVALSTGSQAYLILLVVLIGGVVGFLYYNLRYPTNRTARVFLGDNGSMLLGFLFAWILIDLSQGEQRAMSPVLALWFFSVPLMDTVVVMLRRMWLGKSPFHPDRHHLHHLFIRAGFRIQETVYAIALLHFLFGFAGLTWARAGASDVVMLAAFLAAFIVYFYLIQRPWRFVPVLRRIHAVLGLPSPDTKGVFIGHCSVQGAALLIESLTEQMKSSDDYQLAVYKTTREGSKDSSVYAVIELLTEDNDAAAEDAKKLVNTLKKRLQGRMGIRVRQFRVRSNPNDRRTGSKETGKERRVSDRRSKHSKILIHTAHGFSQPDAIIA